jgi:predicted RNase H-like HicB family nuclease
MLYPVVIHKDPDSGFGVTIPDIPGCFTGGETLEEAVGRVPEALAVHLWGEEQVPAPSRLETLVDDPAYAGGAWMLVDIDTSVLGKARRVNITVPERILRDIDSRARRLGLSRSGFLVRAALEAMAARREGDLTPPGA